MYQHALHDPLLRDHGSVPRRTRLGAGAAAALLLAGLLAVVCCAGLPDLTLRLFRPIPATAPRPTLTYGPASRGVPTRRGATVDKPDPLDRPQPRTVPEWSVPARRPRLSLPPLPAPTARALTTFASGIALFMTSMSPAAYASTIAMVTPPYIAAAADTVQATVDDVRSLMARHSRPAPPVAIGSTSSAVVKVLQGTAQELGVLAASDSIGDLPKDGWFEQFTAVIENSILGLDKVLKQANVPGSLGVAISLFTLGVKAILFPLNYAQLRSATQMQAIQPKAKEIQERYKDDPQKMNLMLAELYRKSDVNPLLAIFPAFAQIPIFIGLYRALVNLGKVNLLDEPFLWLPSLEGPTFDLQPGHTLDWLTQGMLTPSDTLAYLALPVLLVVTQTASTQLNKVPGQEIPQWVWFLPLLTASFSLNVPAGLSVYWIINTIVTTLTTLGVKAYLQNDASIKQASETDVDTLDIDQYQDAPVVPSYQEALLRAVEVDPELASAFSEMRQSPSAVMKYYGNKEFTTKLATAVTKMQEVMVEEQRAKAAAARPKPAPKVVDSICVAVKAGNVTGVKSYLAGGVDANFKDELGISAMHYAVGKGKLDLLQLLVDAGGDVNIVDNQQNSLLHYAAGYGRDNIIQYLGERKLGFNAANTNGQTPMDLAKAGDNKFVTKKTLELLEKFGAKESLVGPLAPEVLDGAETK